MTLVLVGSLLSMMCAAVLAALIERERGTSAELVEAAAISAGEHDYNGEPTIEIAAAPSTAPMPRSPHSAQLKAA